MTNNGTAATSDLGFGWVIRSLGSARNYLFLCSWGLVIGVLGAQEMVVVRPEVVDEVLRNPDRGIQTFQRFRGQEINPGRRWSEVGPEEPRPDAAGKVDFPESTMAYLRWFWWQLEPKQGSTDGTFSIPHWRRRVGTDRRSCFA